ncbi:MAG: ribonuclease HI [Clostridia bacterium]|nr:ribonuclease HI [Clostridia bacterium]
MKEVTIYTDGACSGNPGVGGWCAILMYGENEKIVSGYEPDTTNNRMELKAVICGLKCLKFSPCKVSVYSDSAYVCNAVSNGWLGQWQSNGWRTLGKKDVKNVDLWLELLEMMGKHQVEFIKVKGHSDNEHNNRCDKYARMAIKEFQNL